MKIELLKDKEKCSACGACFEVCPKLAIEMHKDENGFLYPRINEQLCVSCGKCERICTYRVPQEKQTVLQSYAAISKDVSILSGAASGGIFGSLAKRFIKSGYVCGAVFDSSSEEYSTHHIVTNNQSDLKKLQGSKYVQSSSWECYEKVQELLKDGKIVLFSGTPCQVDSIKRITGNPDNLYTLDLICHGVPSMEYLNEYLRILSSYFFSRISNISFRDKSVGNGFNAGITFDNGKKYMVNSELLSYYKYFLSGKIYRESCYSCNYANEKRVGDLTIGDYWGIEEHHPELVKQGESWSCILVNSEKGKKLLELYGDDIKLVETNYQWIKAHNKQLSLPSERPAERDKITNLYRDEGYMGLEKLFLQKRHGKIRYLRQLVKEVGKNKRKLKGNK